MSIQGLTENERAVISAANFFFEDCAYGVVTIADVYYQTDLSFQQIESTIDASAHIQRDGDIITNCPDSGMMGEGEQS